MALSYLLPHVLLHQLHESQENPEISTPIPLHTPKHRYPKSSSHGSYYVYRPPRYRETNAHDDTSSLVASSAISDDEDGGGGRGRGRGNASFLLGCLALLTALAVAAPVRGLRPGEAEEAGVLRRGEVVAFAAYEDGVVEEEERGNEEVGRMGKSNDVEDVREYRDRGLRAPRVKERPEKYAHGYEECWVSKTH